MNVLINFIVYGFIAVTLLISIVGAVYKPPLGIISFLGLAALLLDKNKEVFGKFIISPKIFFRSHMIITGGHRAYFFAFLIALIVNAIMVAARFIN